MRRSFCILAFVLVPALCGGCSLNVSGRLLLEDESREVGVNPVEDGGVALRDAPGWRYEDADTRTDRDSPIVADASDDRPLEEVPERDGSADSSRTDGRSDSDEDVECAPTNEECNAADDDCDGAVDEEGCECRVEQLGDSIYLFCWSGTGQDMNAWDAAAFCEERGYQLVTIDSSEEEGWLIDIAFDIDHQDWGMGLSDEIEEGTWRWPDGTSPVFVNWGLTEPNGGTEENCGEIRFITRAWNDCHCETNRPFVCEAPA